MFKIMATHVYPLNDLQEHILKSTCKCNPTVTVEYGEIIICHNSFDGREIIEQVNEILKDE
jgi:hypothetical protein